MDDKGNKDGDNDIIASDHANAGDDSEADATPDLGHKGEKAKAAPGPASHTLHLGLAVPAGRQSRREFYF